MGIWSARSKSTRCIRYAHYQHEGLDFKHPEGGQALYLGQPWLAHSEDMVRRLAKQTLEPGGPATAMIDNAEEGARMVYEHAPFEFGDLRASGHPTVTSDGQTVYDRAPMVHRLTEEELRVKGHLRNLGLGNR